MSKLLTYVMTLLPIGLVATTAFAAAIGGGGALPWDAPLNTIEQDLSGTTASTIALIAVVGIFGYLVFGGELPVFFRSLVYIVLGVAVLVAGNTLFTSLGITGATVEGGETAYTVYGFVVGSAVTFILVRLSDWLRRKYRNQQAAATVKPQSVND